MDERLRLPVHTTQGDAEVAVSADSPRHHVDVPVFQSPLVTVGRWRCPAEHREYFASGVTSDALFAFPREGVWIEHEGGARFVADPNTVTYYNKGQAYRRHKLSDRGDRCEYFAVATEAIAETLSLHEPGAIDRRERPFSFTHGPCDSESYLRQRTVFHHVTREATPDRLFVEEAVLSILADVTGMAYAVTRGLPRAPRRREMDVIQAARDVIARRFKENLSLSEVAREVESSVFHLARIFRAGTGFSLHAYRNQLRLRSALERLREPRTELTSIALDLGFSSHSHFTDVFRRAFGKTPSAIRDSF